MRGFIPSVLVAFAVVSCSPAALPAAESSRSVAVTAVRRVGKGVPASAEITFGGAVTVREVVVERAGGRTALRFPEYVSGRGRVYPQVRLLTREAMDAARAAVEQGVSAAAALPGGTMSYRISRFTPFRKKGSKVKVFAAVVLNESLEIECKVIEGKYGPWVAWPARRPDGEGRRWVKQVVFPDKRLRERIEAALLERYDTSAGESPAAYGR